MTHYRLSDFARTISRSYSIEYDVLLRRLKTPAISSLIPSRRSSPGRTAHRLYEAVEIIRIAVLTCATNGNLDSRVCAELSRALDGEVFGYSSERRSALPPSMKMSDNTVRIANSIDIVADGLISGENWFLELITYFSPSNNSASYSARVRFNLPELAEVRRRRIVQTEQGYFEQYYSVFDLSSLLKPFVSLVSEHRELGSE